MRRRLNSKGLLALVVVGAVCGAMIFFLHRYQVQRNAAALYQRAQSALADPSLSEQKKLTTAMAYLERYLGFNPPEKKKEEALFELANLRAHEKIATTPTARFRAIMTLDQALRLKGGAEREQERRRLIELALEVGRASDARTHVQYLLERKPNDSDLLALLARCDQESARYRDARKGYEKALKKPNPSVETYARLAGLLRQHPEEVRDPARKEKPDDLVFLANACIAEMVRKNPNSAKAYLARAAYRRLFDRAGASEELVRETEKDVLKARELAGDDPDVLLSLAELAQHRRSPDLARTYLLQGCDKHPTNWRLYLTLAELERDAGRLDAALSTLRNGLSFVPEQPDLLWALASVYVLQGDQEHFDSTVSRLSAAGMPPPELAFLRGRFHLQRKDWAEASRFLDEAFAGLQGRTNGGRNAFVFNLARDAGLLLGECHERLGDFDRAYQAYSRVAALAPQSARARLGMAQARRHMGQLDEAIDNYRQLLRLPGAPADALIELARLTLARNLDRDPPAWDDVDRALTLAEGLQPMPAEVVLLRLEALAAQQKFDQARSYLQSLLVQPRRLFLPAPRLEQVVTALFWQQERLPAVYFLAQAALAELDRKPTEALAWLDRGVKEYGDLAYLRLARIAYWARTAGPDAGKALGLLEGDLGKFKPEERRRILTALAEAHRALLQPGEEKRLWQRVVADWPDDLAAHTALFDLALAARDDAALQREADAIKRIEGDAGVRWRYAEVRRALLRAESNGGRADALADARRHLEAVAKRRASWSRVPLCEAAIAELEDNLDRAADKYLEAFKKGERSANALARAFEVLCSRGRTADAYQVLRKLPRQALAGDLQRRAAEVLLSRDRNEAVRLADAALTGKPSDARQHLWAGRIYWGAGESAKAEKALRKACELDGALAEAWVALTYFLAGAGQKAQALEALARMEKALPEKSAPLAYAQCHEVVGNKEKAERYYKQALAAGEDMATLRGVAAYHLRNGRVKEATPLLQRLEKESARAPEVAAWAGSALQAIRIAGADFAEAQKALATVGRSDALPPGADRPSVTAQRTRASLLARQQGRKNRTEAIRILENLVSLQEATPDDLFQLARLHERQDNWPRAGAYLQALIDLPGGGQPGYLAHFARGLLRHGQLEQAAQVLQRLKKIDPNRFVTAEVEARLLHKQGKTAEAVALIKRRAASGEDLVPSARLLEELGDLAESEKLLQAHARSSDKPAVCYPLISFYARRKQGEKALGLCEELWKKVPVEEGVDLCLQVITEAPEDAALLARVEKLLQAAGGQNPSSSALATALGHLRVLQGRDAEAERIYRQAIQQNPRDILALNALAWLLTMQANNGQEALALTQKAVAVGGPYPWLLDTQAVALLALGQTDKAITLLEEVAAEAPTGAVYFHLAKAYHQARNAAAARRALNNARKEGLKPGELHPAERTALAALQRELGVP